MNKILEAMLAAGPAVDASRAKRDQVFYSKAVPLMKDKEFQKKMGYLWGRWQDEKEYESIVEYGKAVATLLPEGFKLLKMNKRPFGPLVEIDGIKVQFRASGGGFGVKVVR